MSLKVDMVHNGDYWDGPITGLVRIKGRYYHFRQMAEISASWPSSSSDDEDELALQRIYGVFQLRREVMVRLVMRTRQFCHRVGWHQCYRPGEPRRSGNRRPKATTDVWASYYKATDLPPRPTKEEMQEGEKYIGAMIWPFSTVVELTIDEVIDSVTIDLHGRYRDVTVTCERSA